MWLAARMRFIPLYCLPAARMSIIASFSIKIIEKTSSRVVAARRGKNETLSYMTVMQFSLQKRNSALQSS